MLSKANVLLGGVTAAVAGSLIGIYVLFAVAESGDNQREQSAAAAQTIGNLTSISVAMHHYHDQFKRFPPAYLLGADGKPAHSWRVLLLQFLDADLYKQYSFNEAWNGPTNRKLADKMPPCYRVRWAHKAQEKLTSHVVLVGRKTAFPGANTVKIEDITDGLGTTILVAEAEGFNIHWMEPRDWDVEEVPIMIADVKKLGFSSYNPHGPAVALADGTVIRLDAKAPAEELLKMTTIAGGEKVNLKLVGAK